MRINIYAEELTDRTELVSKTVSPVATHDGEEVTFYGTRVYLISLLQQLDAAQDHYEASFKATP